MVGERTGTCGITEPFMGIWDGVWRVVGLPEPLPEPLPELLFDLPPAATSLPLAEVDLARSLSGETAENRKVEFIQGAK